MSLEVNGNMSCHNDMRTMFVHLNDRWKCHPYNLRCHNYTEKFYGFKYKMIKGKKQLQLKKNHSLIGNYFNMHSLK